MYKRLYTITLALVGILVTSNYALAAPGVSYKRRMDVPTVPASIVTKVKNLPWAKVDGLTTVTLDKPSLEIEKDCENVTYRQWKIHRNISTPTKTETYSPYFRTVYESRTATSVKWYIYPSKEGRAGFMPNFFTCRGNDLVTLQSTSDIQNNSFSMTYALIRDTHFSNATEWSNPSQKFTNHVKYDVGATSLLFTKLLDPKIPQYPGLLVLKDGKITGDSRPITFDQKTFAHQHTVPRYRDLTTGFASGTEIVSLFFRIKDGYAVLESEVRGDNQKLFLYVIKNGDAKYTSYNILENDVIASVEKQKALSEVINVWGSKIYIGNAGIQTSPTLVDWVGMGEQILVHGLPTTPKHPTQRFELTKNILWETDYQIYTRYLIKDKDTRTSQYWEAVINKK